MQNNKRLLHKSLCGSLFDIVFFTLAGSPSPSSLRDATSPKGRGKSTAGNFLIAPSTSVMNLTAWLSPWESWRGSA